MDVALPRSGTVPTRRRTPALVVVGYVVDGIVRAAAELPDSVRDFDCEAVVQIACGDSTWRFVIICLLDGDLMAI